MKNELFIIGSDAWSALKRDEVEATARDLKELGLYKLPYPVVDIQLLANDVFKKPDDAEGELGDHISVIFRNVSLDADAPEPELGVRVPHRSEDIARFAMNGTTRILIDPPDKVRVSRVEYKTREHVTDNIAEATNDVTMALIVLLATRNAVKTRRENKLAALGIGKKKHPYRFTTTISLPPELDDADGESTPTGEHKRPHLRRGHIRNQHYGPGLQFIKKVLIAPVFVNADRDWVNARVAYNVSIGSRELVT